MFNYTLSQVDMRVSYFFVSVSHFRFFFCFLSGGSFLLSFFTFVLLFYFLCIYLLFSVSFTSVILFYFFLFFVFVFVFFFHFLLFYYTLFFSPPLSCLPFPRLHLRFLLCLVIVLVLFTILPFTISSPSLTNSDNPPLPLHSLPFSSSLFLSPHV